GLAPEDVHFSRRRLQESTGMSMTQVGIHLERLVSHEFLAAHRGGIGVQHRYTLLQPVSRPFALKLLDVESAGTQRTQRGPNGPHAVGSKSLNGNENLATQRPNGEHCSREPVEIRRTVHVVRA
ncbi:MAG: hypothetical protein AAFY15_11085, partial [Cyanobacteria bacterium J06648_11]